MKLGAAAACALICVAAAATATSAGASQPRFTGPFGTGADAVWLLTPRSRPRSVVVFLHGWKIAPPSPSYPWVGQFRPWLDDLVAHGNAVIFPAYQDGLEGQGPAHIDSLRRGLEEGFRHLARPFPSVVVAGYSYGASLGFYYAADARSWGLPVPRAVDAVFPAEPIPGAALPQLSPSVNVLIQVGDEDTVAGRGGADAFWSWLSARRSGRQRLVVVRSSPEFAAVHAAPKSTTQAARRAFWEPLDALVSSARTARESRAGRPSSVKQLGRGPRIRLQACDGLPAERARCRQRALGRKEARGRMRGARRDPS